MVDVITIRETVVYHMDLLKQLRISNDLLNSKRDSWSGIIDAVNRPQLQTKSTANWKIGNLHISVVFKVYVINKCTCQEECYPHLLFEVTTDNFDSFLYKHNRLRWYEVTNPKLNLFGICYCFLDLHESLQMWMLLT